MLQFYKYPQTNLNQQNLDWVIQTIKDLQKQIGNGGVKVVDTYAEMTDINVIYVYTGSEPGMSTDHWYYYDTATSTWVDGGSWGGASITLPLAISDGGTGATTAAGARNALGLGNTSGALPIANGGTGSQTAAAAYAALGGGAAGKLDTVDVAHGGTGATTVAGARNALGLGNTSGALPVANGGTGSQTAAAARSALGITPTAIGAEPAIDVLPVTKGGTGETSLADLKNTLGLSILSAYHTELPGTTTTDIPVPNFFHGIMLISGPLATSNGALCVINTNSSGSVSRYDVNVPSGLTLTNGTGLISCANSTAYKAYAMLIGEVIS